jgi:hypothetical protein
MNESEGIGGIEGITLEGSKGRLNISSMGDIYLLTVTPKKADINYINTVTRVLIPTMLKLLDKINPASLKWGQGKQTSPHSLYFLIGGSKKIGSRNKRIRFSRRYS